MVVQAHCCPYLLPHPTCRVRRERVTLSRLYYTQVWQMSVSSLPCLDHCFLQISKGSINFTTYAPFVTKEWNLFHIPFSKRSTPKHAVMFRWSGENINPDRMEERRSSPFQGYNRRIRRMKERGYFNIRDCRSWGKMIDAALPDPNGMQTFLCTSYRNPHTRGMIHERQSIAHVHVENASSAASTAATEQMLYISMLRESSVTFYASPVGCTDKVLPLLA